MSEQRIRPCAIAYHPHRMIRHVLQDEMSENSIGRYIEAFSSLATDLAADGGKYHLLLDARKKSFTSLDGTRLISKGLRHQLVEAQIDRKALVSSRWFGSADEDGIPSFETLPEGWLHLTTNTYSIPRVSLVAGSTGAGKTTFAKFLVGDLGAIRFSSDEWMNHLYKPERLANAGFDWYWERIQRIETVMRGLGEQLILRSMPIVLDLGLSTRKHRHGWLAWVRMLGFEPWIFYVDVDGEERWDRVQARNRAPHAASTHVTRAMFDFVEQRFESPTSEEGMLATVRW